MVLARRGITPDTRKGYEMNYTPTAYDFILRVIDKAPWPGDMEPTFEFQEYLARSIVMTLQSRGFLVEQGDEDD